MQIPECLLVDDDVRDSGSAGNAAYKILLGRDQHYSVMPIRSIRPHQAILELRPDVIFLDVELSTQTGFDLAFATMDFSFSK